VPTCLIQQIAEQDHIEQVVRKVEVLGVHLAQRGAGTWARVRASIATDKPIPGTLGPTRQVGQILTGAHADHRRAECRPERRAVGGAGPRAARQRRTGKPAPRSDGTSEVTRSVVCAGFNHCDDGQVVHSDGRRGLPGGG
jgi:hypothetical protein